MANKPRKCRLNVFWVLGLALILTSLAITANVILTGKTKVGNDDE